MKSETTFTSRVQWTGWSNFAFFCFCSAPFICLIIDDSWSYFACAHFIRDDALLLI